MNNNYKENNIGALFKNAHRQKDNAPLLKGCITLNRALVKHLSRLIDNDEPAKLTLAAWKNTSKAGAKYFTIKADAEHQPASFSETEDEEIDL